jgi:hypothetical protein
MDDDGISLKRTSDDWYMADTCDILNPTGWCMATDPKTGLVHELTNDQQAQFWFEYRISRLEYISRRNKSLVGELGIHEVPFSMTYKKTEIPKVEETTSKVEEVTADNTSKDDEDPYPEPKEERESILSETASPSASVVDDSTLEIISEGKKGVDSDDDSSEDEGCILF